MLNKCHRYPFGGGVADASCIVIGTISDSATSNHKPIENAVILINNGGAKFLNEKDKIGAKAGNVGLADFWKRALHGVGLAELSTKGGNFILYLLLQLSTTFFAGLSTTLRG